MKTTITGYEFDTAAKAAGAVRRATNYHLGEVSEDRVTSQWTSYARDLNGKCYIIYHPTLVEVLGEPTRIEIETEDINKENEL